VGELESVLDQMEAEDLTALPDAALEEDFAGLQRSMERLEIQRLRRLAAIDERRPYLRDGYLSTSSWFAHQQRVAHSTAAGDLRMARALEAMPRTRDAVASGNISFSVSRILSAARETDPEAFAESEPLLLDAATRHSVRDLQRVVAHWRSAVEARHLSEQGEDSLRKRRRLHVSPTIFGMVRIGGDLDPETGETVLSALGSCVDADIRTSEPEDWRTVGQRRADALGEICRRWLDSAERPTVGGERPHLTVTIDLDALATGQGTGEFDHLGPIAAGTAKRLACDASVSRVIFSGRSEPLDVGRRTPVVQAPLRRAVALRDRQCRFPGCDRPPPWCDAHHVVHWADGGPTSLANLVLLCRRHHRIVHHGFGVEMADGERIFRRPDGTILDERSPPQSRGPMAFSTASISAPDWTSSMTASMSGLSGRSRSRNGTDSRIKAKAAAVP
jgi:hypothetical protein